MEEGRVVYSTIGGGEAVGICGSGLMDVVAMLLNEGFLEDTGRLMDPDELENEYARANKDRIIKIGGKNAFSITEKVYISQKDIGEVQQAKAAIAAGVILLCGKMGIPVSGIFEHDAVMCHLWDVFSKDYGEICHRVWNCIWLEFHHLCGNHVLFPSWRDSQ